MSKNVPPPPSKSGFAHDGYQPGQKGYQPVAPKVPVAVKPPSRGSNVTPPPPKKD
jgi:hypothetical protein